MGNTDNGMVKMEEEKPKPKLWFEGEKTYNIIFINEDLNFLLALLDSKKGGFIPTTDEEKTASRVMSRILIQMR
jgi:hypothetical protein